MSWELIGSISPGREWQFFALPLTTRLIRLSYFGDAVWLEKYQPSAYLRLRVGADGTTESWDRIWPKNGEQELVVLTPIPIAFNFLDIRKRRNFESLQANYSITVEGFQAAPYTITYEPTPVEVDGAPLTIDGNPLEI